MRRLLKWGCGGLIVVVVLGGILSALGGGETEQPADTEPTQQAQAEPATDTPVPATATPGPSSTPAPPTDTPPPTNTPLPTNTPAPTNTPLPTNTPPPPTATPAPTATPEPVTLSGTSQTATDEVELPSPISIAHFTHNGQSNFIVRTYIGDREDVLINEIGPYDGSRPLTNGPVIFDINADGAWIIEIRPIGRQDSAAFSGDGDDVSDLFAPPDRGAWELSHNGESNFIVYLHCAGGSQVVQNEIGAVSGSTIIGFRDGPCFWEVEADGEWSLKPR